MKAPYPRPTAARSLLIAMGIGLGAGLLLSIPLRRSLAPGPATEAGDSLLPISNPFAAWSGFGNREVVVLGMDAGGGNTDAIFTIRVENGETRITQIPRDSYIDSRNFGPMKVNALYARGGAEAVKQELSRLMGRPIQHHILVNLEGIRTMGELVGGVRMSEVSRRSFIPIRII